MSTTYYFFEKLRGFARVSVPLPEVALENRVAWRGCSRSCAGDSREGIPRSEGELPWRVVGWGARVGGGGALGGWGAGRGLVWGGGVLGRIRAWSRGGRGGGGRGRGWRGARRGGRVAGRRRSRG